MGMLAGFLGLASEANPERVEAEFASILAEGEQVERAYMLVRDLIVFTNKRLVIVDKQGITGSRAEWLSIPYRAITRFSKETAGPLDIDSELRIWVGSEPEPLKKEFRGNKSVHEIYQVLSQYVLR